MSKSTLSVSKPVAERAKRYAKRQGTSVSKLVEDYLSAVTEPPEIPDEPPVLRSLRGMLKRGSRADYRRHLAEKYR